MSESIKKITGVILAAGTGSRMGATKQLLPFGETTLLGRMVNAATASDLDKIVVVLGHHAAQIQKRMDLSGTRIVINPHYLKGQATSLRAGLAEIVWDCSGAMFLLADQPLIDHHIINTLIQAWQTSKQPMMVPYCNGSRGNPVIVGASLFEAVCRITGDRGARALFDEYASLIKRVDIQNPAILTDVDTKEEYDRLVGL